MSVQDEQFDRGAQDQQQADLNSIASPKQQTESRRWNIPPEFYGNQDTSTQERSSWIANIEPMDLSIITKKTFVDL